MNQIIEQAALRSIRSLRKALNDDDLSKVERLSLTKNLFANGKNELDISELKQFQNLKELIISCRKFSNSDFEILSSLKNLKILYLDFCRFENECLADRLPFPTQLDTLTINMCGILLFKNVEWPNLKNMYLVGSEKKDYIDFGNVQTPNLENIHVNNFKPIGLDELIRSTKVLQEANLDGSVLPPVVIDALKEKNIKYTNQQVYRTSERDR